jgi:UDP-N-acetylglucosamine--N-acetylmuramyl-(pentapeptide) pyrophosphoryl-undecaprenol N-acetylglucosamine transferase
MEKDLVERESIPFKAIPAAGVHGVGVKALPGNLLRLLRGTIASRKILRDYQPDVLLFTGGYVAIPMAAAGYRFQSLVYIPDIEPGLALKALIRLSDYVAVTADISLRFIKGRPAKVTGYPTRIGLEKWDMDSGRKALDIETDKPIILITGGSKGAHSINEAVSVNLAELLDMAAILHITGQADYKEISEIKSRLGQQAKDYYPHPYLHEMGAALAAANLVVSRAGASILGEYPFFGLPAILVPYPHAWKYQRVNAQYLVDNGGAVILDDSVLRERLPGEVRRVISDKGIFDRMHKSMLSLAKPEAAKHIADLLVQMTAGGNQNG